MAKNPHKILENKIVQILRKSEQGYSAKELSKLFGIRKKDYNFFRKSLELALSSGKIKKVKSTKKYIIPSKSRVITGKLQITRDGFGFVPDEEKNVDIFIGRDHLNTAFDKDIVEVKVDARFRGKNEEGFVSRIEKRSREKFVGTFHQTQYYGFVVPDNPKVYRDFFIPKEKLNGAKDGQKVLVHLDKWETDHLNPEGTITEIIGYPSEPGVDVASVALSYQIDIKFPKTVELEAGKISDEIDENEIKNRRDLRNETCFTIDPKDAKDFDDAISLKFLENGNYLLGVHIADVSYYVKENSKIDDEAYKRGTSVYLVDRVLPMLPEKLSNQICSLQPLQDRFAVSCIMEISSSGEVVKYDINPSIIISKKRFSYEEVQHVIDANENNGFLDELCSMMKLSKILRKKRFEVGGIDFETPEVSFELDEKGFPKEIKRKKILDSHRLVEEFMLLANKTVAEHILNISPEKYKLPFVYRVHEKPDPDKMNKFFEFLKALGFIYNPVKRVTSRYFQKILNEIKGTKEEFVIEEVALRSMMKAVYSIKNAGHFGLGFKDYTHFTSPIRRYPDLMVHRLLKKYMQSRSTININSINVYLKNACEQSSKMERIAMEAERESIKLKKNEYISKHIGEEFEGIISGVKSFGIFVELNETLVEGLVHIQDMDDDYYIYDEKTFSLIGRDTERVFRLGDEVNIKVKDVKLESNKVDFLLTN